MPLFNKSKSRHHQLGSVISAPVARGSYEEAQYYASLRVPQSAPPTSYFVRPDWRGPHLRTYEEDDLEELDEERPSRSHREYDRRHDRSRPGKRREPNPYDRRHDVGHSEADAYETRKGGLRLPAPFREHRAPPSESRSAPDRVQKHAHHTAALYGAKSVTDLSLHSSDLASNKRAAASKHARKPSSPDEDDGSERWTTRTGEALAKVRLTTLAKSLEESSESLFTAITTFTLDLSDPDPKYDANRYLSIVASALAHLKRLTSLRIVGPRDSRIALPQALALSISKSNAQLESLALSRISNIEDASAFARSIGHSTLTLKLNDCKAPVWRPLLKYCVSIESIEALVPPEGLQWLSRNQWAGLKSMRLGYGSIDALNDLLESATAVEGEPIYETSLETLVISHFQPLPLDVIVRLSRTLGTSHVKKLELSRISAEIFEPRLMVNLAAYFENVEDLRIHSADDGEEDLAIHESRKARTRPVNWSRGRYGMDDYGLAFASFGHIRTLKINHSREPELLNDQAHKTSSKDPTDRDLITSSGKPLKELLMVDARNLAAKVRSLKRIGYSFSLNGHYLDVAITYSKRTFQPEIRAHWSVPKDKT